jgi:hypothetical protein
VLDGILVGIIDASLLRKAMQSCSGVDTLANKIEKLIVGDMPRAKIIALVRTEIYSFISLRSRKGRHVINA